MQNTKILLIYTGGTIGMITDPETGSLKPFDFSHITTEVPELKKFKCKIDAVSFDEPIDSSNMSPAIWVNLAGLIYENYSTYDGFVVLHGSDTMAYTASALSFMMQGLNKPIVFTGAQLPIGVIRTDGKENLITAIEIAAAKENGKPKVPEVVIYFEYLLYRANRTKKVNSQYFEAFHSPNYPVLAEAGIEISYNEVASNNFEKPTDLTLRNKFCTNVASIKLFPGIREEVVRSVLDIEGLKGFVIETYGSGNAPINGWLRNLLADAVSKGIVVVNITQCVGGGVYQEKYETGRQLSEIGVIGGVDLTFEAAVTKLMHLLGECETIDEVKDLMKKSLVGEMRNN